MSSITLKNNVTIIFHDSIDELPQSQFIAFEKVLLRESSIGSDLEAFDSHLTKIFLFLNKDKKEDAINELLNLRQNLFLITNDISLSLIALSCLVKSKKKVTDSVITETSNYILRHGIKKKDISLLVENIKKKYNQN